MLNRTKDRALVIALVGSLFAVACGDTDTMTDNSPIIPNLPMTPVDAGQPPAQMAPVDSGTPAMVTPNKPMDSGMMMPVKPAQPEAGMPMMPPVNDDAGAVDSGMGTSPEAGTGGPVGMGKCCPDGKCLCHGEAPAALTAKNGPYKTKSYTVSAGCIYYPDGADTEPPYAAVAISDGFLGAGGCGSFQTGQWGPLYASWGIVAMIVNTGSSDQPAQRATALAAGIAAFKSENMKAGSPLMGKLAGRYGTSGFSMGGGGTTIAAQKDKTLLSDVALMPWGPTNSGVTVPTLVVCGSSDGTAPCAQHGTPAYNGIGGMVPKMRIQINSGHAGQPTSGNSVSGQYGLAWQKVFLEGDTRWLKLLQATGGAVQASANIPK